MSVALGGLASTTSCCSAGRCKQDYYSRCASPLSIWRKGWRGLGGVRRSRRAPGKVAADVAGLYAVWGGLVGSRLGILAVWGFWPFGDSGRLGILAVWGYVGRGRCRERGMRGRGVANPIDLLVNGLLCVNGKSKPCLTDRW